MKVTFISPPFGVDGARSAGLPIAPPVIEYMAGLTEQVHPDARVTLVDANRREFDPETFDADLVGITVLTPQAPWAYRTADTLRSHGFQVVLGGMHVNANPEEASEHADSIVVGEPETVWGRVLADTRMRTLKPRYDGPFCSLSGLPRPRTDLLPDVYPFGSFFTARGCPHSCGFCSVHAAFGHTVRMRPIDEVVREVAASERRLFFNVDDNVWGVDFDRSIALFKEMAKQVKGKWWFGQGDLVSAQHPRADEMLEAAREAGMVAIMCGYESDNPRVLRELHATSKQGRDRLDAIKRIRSHGIDVMLFMMVGSREHRAEDFDGVLDLTDRLCISAHPVMTTPFPGTRLRDEYGPYLIPGIGWDRYDGNHATFYHDDPEMTPEARERAVRDLRAALFNWPKMFRRVGHIARSGFPMSHIASLMIQYPQGRAFKEFARDHEDLQRDPNEKRPWWRRRSRR
ncbi:MAG: radical SAM protein [Coriobacteriia bacterium]